MKQAWSKVSLGEVLSQRKEFIVIDDLATYKRPRVQLHAKGIVLRDEVDGALIKTKRQQVCRAGEFLVAEIDAKVGGFGIVPNSLDRAIVSSHYFLFCVDEARLDRRFLDYFIRTREFRDQVEAQGSTNYAAIRPADVLGYNIQLPHIAEQQRIVTRIEAVAEQVREVKRLRLEAAQEQQALCRAMLATDPEVNLVPMSELVTLRQPDVTVHPNKTYQFAGVYSFGRGLFRGQEKSGVEFAYPKLTTLRTGNFTYPKLMAWEGALGVVPQECDACVVSTEFPVFEIREDRVLPEVLDVHFRNPAVWPQLSGSSTGTNVRRRRLNPTEFLKYRMPVPSRLTQVRLRSVMSELSKLSPIDRQVSAELDALLPAILDKAFRGELM